MLVSVPMLSIKPPIIEPPAGHGDEEFTRLAVLEQTDGEITFVAGDVEFVRERPWRVSVKRRQRLAGISAQAGDFSIEFFDEIFEQCHIHSSGGRHGLSPPSLVFFVLSGRRLEPSR